MRQEGQGDATAAALAASDEVLELIRQGSAAVLEVSSDPAGEAYARGHVPTARWAYWKDLLWHPTERSLAAPELVERRLELLGVPAGQPLVLYGDPVQYGTYAYWALEAQGLDRPLRLLDGARAGWRQAGLPLEQASAGGERHVERSQRVRCANASDAAPTRGRGSCVVGRDDVLAIVRGAWPAVLLDVRSREEYEGRRVAPSHLPIDHGAERAGRIPGALHLPYERLLGDADVFLPAEELRATFAAHGIDATGDVVTYCRLSHRASLCWFALAKLLGWEGVSVYDGSWTEWGSMVGMPVEAPGR